ncbi:hypothetical protein HA402_015220 [Bradysia odoriphaga]|nr:hypothetical protein HA402_015220 [Bradysia odoriphaga]
MSLFQLCRWWYTQCPDFGTNYDNNSMHCCRIGSNDNDKDYIVVGSHSGHLSIFNPSGDPPDNNNDNAFKATDVLIEMKLPNPIIGIESGKFIGSKENGKCQLAILHPMKLSIYAIHTTEGHASHGDQSKLELCYEYKFQRFAFSFCKGNFGSVKGKEFFCVVHMDSSLSFFEQDSIAYECILPGERNIPSVFVYVQRIDSFITVSTAYDVECFRYQDLSQSSETGGKVIEAMWVANIGMDWMALDVTSLQLTKDQSVIMILGENHFISIADDGSVRFIKRLDYSPMCFHCFVIGWYWEPNARLITSIVSESGSLLIYEESTLIWAAQLAEVPVSIQRSNVNGLAGAVVTLSETGQLQVGFLGSEPQPFKVPPLNLSELNYENVQKELAELEKDIKSGIDFTDLSLTKALAKKDLQLKVTVDSRLEPCNFSTKNSFEVARQMCRVSLIVTPSVSLEQIQILFVTSEPLVCSEPLHFLRNVPINTSKRVDVWMYFSNTLPAHCTDAKVVVSFINQQSICRILEESISLPIKLFFSQHSPQKEALIKITFSVEGSAETLSLSALFAPDYSMESDLQAVGFKSNITNTVITVITNKQQSNRIRIQSDDLTLFGAFLDVIKCRIEEHTNKSTAKSQNQATKLKLVFLPKIPINEILSKIDDHTNALGKVKLLQDKLDSRSAQMRLIVRSMFIKLEDKKENATEGVLMLYKTTQDQINEVLKELDTANYDLKQSRQSLSCAIAMCRIIVENLDLPNKTTEGLCSILITPIVDWINNTWEETTNDSLDRLNHIGALRKNKNASVDDHPTYAATTLDISRYKRRLSALLERVCRLCSKKDNSQDENNLLETDCLEEEENEEENKSDWVNDSQPQVDLKLSELVTADHS